MGESPCPQMKIRSPENGEYQSCIGLLCHARKCPLLSPEQEIETCVYSRAVLNALLTSRYLNFFAAYLHYGRATAQSFPGSIPG
jgi:hypothetical protein